MMRIVGRLASLDDQTLFLGRVVETTARGYPVEADLKRDCRAWFGGLETCDHSKC